MMISVEAITPQKASRRSLSPRDTAGVAANRIRFWENKVRAVWFLITCRCITEVILGREVLKVTYKSDSSFPRAANY